MNEHLILAKLLAGYPKEKVDISSMNGLGGIAQTIMKAEDRLKTFEMVIAHLPDADDIRQKVFSANPTADSEDDPLRKFLESQTNEQTLIMPELPDYARPNPEQEREALTCAGWLNDYTDYASRRAPMLPKEFHESAGLWLLSLSVARRLKVPMPHDDIYPNLFLLWVAPTTIYSKSTGLNIARNIAEETMPHLLLSNEFSPEGLLDDMAGKPPSNLHELPEKQRQSWELSRKFSSKRGLLLDEASSLFASFKRDFNTGLAEALMRFYDCSNHRGRTRGRGMAIVKDSYLCFLGATTQNGIKQANITSLWESGLWPRFGLLVPTEKPVYKRFVSPPDRPKNLTSHLIRVCNEWLPTPKDSTDYPVARAITLGSGVFNAWKDYDRAIYNILLGKTPVGENLYGIYGRLPTQALKIASCLAVADWAEKNNTPQIELYHFHRAQIICERWRASTHQLYYNLTGITAIDTLEQKVLQIIEKAGKKGITIRETYRQLRCKREEIEPVIYRLENDGLVQRFRVSDKARADYYRLITYCDS